MKPFQFGVPTKVFFGSGSIAEVKATAGQLGKKALLVTGRSSARRTGVLDKVVGLLGEAGVAVIVNEEVDPNPKSTHVDRMAELVNAEKCDFVIGLGGGSPMDSAKAIALTATNGGPVIEFFPGASRSNWGVLKPALPIMAITTTAGTGAEVTRVAVVTNRETHEKPAILHPSMAPTIAIVDPDLMMAMPPALTAETGVDVLFHALETLVASTGNAFTDMVAEEAVKLVVANLETAYRDGSDKEARARMAWANVLGGLSIDGACPVAVHGFGHPIGGHYNVAHARALAAIGPAVLDYTYDADVDRYAKLSRLLGVSDAGLTNAQLAARAGDALRAYLKTVDMNITLTDLGVTRDSFEQMAKDGFTTCGHPIGASLKPLTVEDGIKIYEMSL